LEGKDAASRRPPGYVAGFSVDDRVPLQQFRERFKPNEWFTLEVIADGNHRIEKYNGQVILDVVDKETKYRRGHIVLRQLNSTATFFRKIEIKELPSAKSETDQQRLQGRWILVEANFGGGPVPKQEYKGYDLGTLLFKDNRWGHSAAGKEREGTFTVHPDKSPAEIDLSGSIFKDGGPDKGIYLLEGDTLKLCLPVDTANPNPPRPASFTVDNETGIFIFRRETAPAVSDQESLQGAWKLVGGEDEGKPWPAAFIPTQMNMTLTFAGDKADLKWLPPKDKAELIKGFQIKTAWEGVLHLDTKTNPKRMTVFVPNNNSNSMIGIYRLDGNRLTLCYRYNPQKLDYPTEFKTKKNDGLILLVFERVAVPAPPPQPIKIKVFDPKKDQPATQVGVTQDQGGWRIESKQKQDIVFFIVPGQGIKPEGRLVLRGQSKASAGADGKVDSHLLWRRPNGFFGATGLVPLVTKNDWEPWTNAITLNADVSVIEIGLRFSGPGTVWLKNLELVQEPVAAPAPPNVPFALTAEQVLPHMVGTWTAEFTQRPDPAKPATTHTGPVIVESVAGGRCIRIRTKMNSGGPDDLQFLWLDANKSEFGGLYFDVAGAVLVKGGGRYDAATRTLTIANWFQENNFGVKNVRFIDADTITWDVVGRDKSGKTTFDVGGKMKRQARPGSIEETVGDPKALPVKMAALDRLVGTWNMEADDLSIPEKPNIGVAGTVTTAKILGGRFIEFRERDRTSGAESYMLVTWDLQENKYRFWHFSSRWGQLAGIGDCNFNDSGFASPITWGFQNSANRGFLTWELLSDKRYDFDFKIWDKAVDKEGHSKLLGSVKGSYWRQQPEKAPPPRLEK
jgi:uncharacterized protein (TIGR03067 family)